MWVHYHVTVERNHTLIVCNYSARYPEVTTLCSIDAGTVAELLIPRVGIPKEILSDQGTNFMAQTLKELYNLLKVTQI